MSATKSSATVYKLRPDPSPEIVVVPNGVYTLAFDRYALTSRFRRGSLELWFRIMDYGPHFESPICGFYRVDLAKERSFRASPRSRFARNFAAVFGQIPPTGVQAIGWFRDVLVEARVGVVDTDHEQNRIPEAARYSVIRELLGQAK